MYVGNIKFLIIAGLILSGAVIGFLLSFKYTGSPYERMMKKKSFDKQEK